MSKPITFPPGVWLVAVVGIAAFVQDQFPFPEYPWSPGVVIILGMVAKLLEVYMPQSKQESTARGYLWTGRAWRFWIGG